MPFGDSQLWISSQPDLQPLDLDQHLRFSAIMASTSSDAPSSSKRPLPESPDQLTGAPIDKEARRKAKKQRKLQVRPTPHA